MKLIVVGAGGIAQELLRRLGEMWDVTVVEPDERRLEALEAPRPFRSVVGDGSSAVVLRRAGIAAADALVAATQDAETNLEVIRLAKAADVARLVAVAVRPGQEARFRELEVSTVSPDSLAARRIELSLETRRLASMAFADGRAEAIEFRLAPESPLRGKRLADLHAASWIVGAVLRQDRLIIPHGDTVLEAGDRVTVVGAGSAFAEIVRTFTAGAGRFPLDFGKRVAVVVGERADVDGPLAEAVQLVRNSRASSLLVLRRDAETVRDEIATARLRELDQRIEAVTQGVETRLRHSARPRGRRALARAAAEESVGVIVLPGGRPRSLRAFWRAWRAVEMVGASARPVLLSRGSAPYGRILVPARRSAAGRAALRAATDLARFGGAELQGLAVVDPIFIAGLEADAEAHRAVDLLREEAALQGVEATGAVLRGNPVRTFASHAAGAGLVVLALARRGRSPLGRLRIAAMIASRAPCSVLLVPAMRWS